MVDKNDGRANFAEALDTDAWLRHDSIAYQAAVRSGAPACFEFKTGLRLTYGELDTLVGKCAGWLERIFGDPRGVRVAMLSRNSINFIVLLYACERAGAIFQPLNWRLAGAELHLLAEMASPRLFVYEEEFESQALEALRDLQITAVRISAEDDRFRAGIDAAPSAAAKPAGPNDPCLLLSTSGTTGKPKGVIVTRKNLFASAVNFSLAGHVTPETVQLCDLPIFHVAALYCQVRSTLFQGGLLYISDRLHVPTTLQRLSDASLGITHYFLVPQIAQMLLDDPAFAKADLSRIAVFTGGAPAPQGVMDRFLTCGIPLTNGLGMSEAGTIMTMPVDLQAIRRKPQSVGIPAYMLEVRVVSADGRDAEAGQVGEIWLRGPSITPGYWNNPEATSAAFSGSWFKTGDAGRRDEDGFYHLVDRWKDMYISGGENVYPAEVESVILSVDAVADAAVIGVPDQRWGEVGCAYVVLREAATVEAEQILAHCSRRLARYKQPALIRFVEDIPRTASGKIKKDILRRQFADTLPQSSGS
jgi:fatty-acyl-CoA synthase